MATTSIRPAVKTYLVENLTGPMESHDAVMLRSWDGKKFERSTAFILRTTGTISFPYAMAGRKARHDDFSVRIQFVCLSPAKDPEEAEQQVMDMAAELEDLVANDVSAGGLDGLTHFTLGETDGPESFPLGDQGFRAMYEVDVDCQSQLI